MFSKMMGKESVRNDNMSVSGSRYAVALNNLNVSSQEVARDLMNPDELMKLPYTDCIVLAEGMPPYMGKKNAYYNDDRVKSRIYYENQDTGEITGRLPPYSQEEINREVAGLPSNVKRREEEKVEEIQSKERIETTKQETEKKEFDPVNFLETYLSDENGNCEDWDSPWEGYVEDDNDEPPPKIATFVPEDFDVEESVY
jgi:type IV secretion system protein VirD4